MELESTESNESTEEVVDLTATDDGTTPHGLSTQTTSSMQKDIGKGKCMGRTVGNGKGKGKSKSMKGHGASKSVQVVKGKGKSIRGVNRHQVTAHGTRLQQFQRQNAQFFNEDTDVTTMSTSQP